MNINTVYNSMMTKRAADEETSGYDDLMASGDLYRNIMLGVGGTALAVPGALVGGNALLKNYTGDDQLLGMLRRRHELNKQRKYISNYTNWTDSRARAMYDEASRYLREHGVDDEYDRKHNAWAVESTHTDDLSARVKATDAEIMALNDQIRSKYPWMDPNTYIRSKFGGTLPWQLWGLRDQMKRRARMADEYARDMKDRDAAHQTMADNGYNWYATYDYERLNNIVNGYPERLADLDSAIANTKANLRGAHPRLAGMYDRMRGMKNGVVSGLSRLRSRFKRSK